MADLNKFPLLLESYFSDLEIRIMQDIVRKIKENGEMTRAADWQLNRVKELGQSEALIKEAIKILLANTKVDVYKMYQEAAEQEWVRNKELYTKTNKEFTPFAKNTELQQFVKAVSKQTNEEFKNITNSLGLVKDTATGLKSESLSDAYKRILDDAILDVASGAFDYNTAVKRAVKEMINSGIRTIDYESGYTRRVQTACQNAITTGLNQLTAKVAEMNMDALETDFVEVSWHATARTGIGAGNHQEWQGYVYHWNRHNTDSQGYKDFVESTGYGVNPLGIHGYNCRHLFYAFIPGVSTRTYTDEFLKEQREKANLKIKFAGKEYTMYEATQRMRTLETRMRAQRQEIKLMQDGNASLDDITSAKARYRTTMDEYVRFAAEMGLPQQRQRIFNDGLGRIGFAKSNSSGIINVKSTTTTGVPNTITQITHKNGGITRNYYDAEGKWSKQLTNNDHGNKKNHPFGKKGEHVHDIKWKDGKVVERKVRELTDIEREENKDIL